LRSRSAESLELTLDLGPLVDAIGARLEAMLERKIGDVTPRAQHDEALSVSEAAKLLGVGRRSVYELVRVGRLRAVRLGAEGHRMQIPRDAIEALLAGNSSNASSNELPDTNSHARLQPDTTNLHFEMKSGRRNTQK
jgi:excisionase family DNA binding protein